MKEHKVNKKNNFIGGWYIDKKVCANLIKYFERAPHKKRGGLGLEGGKPGIDIRKKLSTDVRISVENQDLAICLYYEQLGKVATEYKKKYKYCTDQQLPWGIIEDWNIQKYNPKEGYFSTHFERTGGLTANRHLAFMTYLNDVKEGGETEFYYQKLRFKPETGLTLIWGTDWTFTHRGITAPKETKYIATGWYSFKPYGY
jgi:hypothetical protein